MAINSIIITQNNYSGLSNLLAVHSPISFIADVDYTGETPINVLVDIIEDGDVIKTYSAIPYRDTLSTTRQFVFFASDLIRGLMADFSDETQLSETLLFLSDISKTLTIKFYDPDDLDVYDQVECTFMHAARQIGESPNLSEVFNNEDDTYLCAENSFAYVYFFNENPANTITVNNANLNTVPAEDYNSDVFTDYDGEIFYIDI